MNIPSSDPEFNPFSAPASVETASNAPKLTIPLIGYSTVRRGLQLIYYSIAAMALMVISMLLMGLAGIFMSNSSVSGFEASGMAIFGLFGLTVIGAMLAYLVGICMCCASPNPNEKGLAVSACICFFANIGASVLQQVLAFVSTDETVFILIAIVSNLGSLAGVASTILFCLLLKKIGTNIGSQLLEQASKSALNWFFLLIGVAIVGVVAMIGFAFLGGTGGMRTNAGAGVLIVFGLGFLFLGLGSFFKYLAMIRTGIDELKPPSNA